MVSTRRKAAQEAKAQQEVKAPVQPAAAPKPDDNDVSARVIEEHEYINAAIIV